MNLSKKQVTVLLSEVIPCHTPKGLVSVAATNHVDLLRPLLKIEGENVEGIEAVVIRGGSGGQELRVDLGVRPSNDSLLVELLYLHQLISIIHTYGYFIKHFIMPKEY